MKSAEPIRAIVKAIREALECVPPELSGDIFERGVVLTGGVAMLRKFDEHLHKETGLPVLIAEDPMATVVVGVGKLLTDLTTIPDFSMPRLINSLYAFDVN